MYHTFLRAFLRNTNIRKRATTKYCGNENSSASKHVLSYKRTIYLDNIEKVFKRKMSTTEAPTTSAAAAAAAAATGAAKPKRHTNRLINEKSPYLLQHAHNPVDWYPWCDEALELARKKNKLIFLSVGYSTCHWCHVMEHESFEDEEVAAIMNENFINIKVDREERPDIDKIYMQFTVMLNGHGGWPMSVWLTPDLAPITAGTYFPPTNRYGVPAFRTALTAVAKQWKDNEDTLKVTGLKVITAIQNAVSSRSEAVSAQDGSDDTNSADSRLEEAVFLYKRRYDSLYGGFGSHPKFPEVPRLTLLFHAYLVNQDIDVLDMALTTLEKIAQGGIHDHIGGGFSRYSVDCVWHVPHFEKMLYDQGQLMSAYAAAYKLTGDKQFLNAAQGIYEYLMRDLRNDLGAFYAGEDADSLPDWESAQKVEGAFYAWHWTEIEETIQKNINAYDHLNLTHSAIVNVYAKYYDLSTDGNVNPTSDPHEHFTNKNILIMRGNVDEICLKYQINMEQLQEIVQTTNKFLLKVRAQKPRPHLDTKIICSWNALTLSGLCELASCETDKRDEYVQTAEKLYEFIRKYLYVAETQTLLHAVYGEIDKKHGLSKGQNIQGFLDDYAFLINALLSYYKLSLDAKVLDWAWQLQQKQHALFWDEENSGYFYSQAHAKDLVVRLKDDHDGAEPSGNSIAARNLVLLSHYFDASELAKQAEYLLQTFTEVTPFGYTLPQMLSAQLLLEHGIDIVAVVGTEAESKEHLKLLRKYYIPGLVIFKLDPSSVQSNERLEALQQKYKMINNKTTVYICHNRVCRLPLTDVSELEKTLKENYYSPRP